MPRIPIRSLTAAVVFAAAVIPIKAQSASFDCGKAMEPDEITICNTPELSALDSEMGALWFTYSKLPLYMGASGARQDEAQAFLRRRGECGANAACLRRLYEKRIHTLRREIQNNLPTTPD